MKNKIKCDVATCKHNNCDKNCIEIKGTTKIKSSDNRRLFNLLKKQTN